MKRSCMLRSLGLCLTALLLLCATAGTAWAADVSIDTERKGTISVTMQYGDEIVSGGTLSLYHVADIQKSGGAYRYVPTSDFAGYGGALNVEDTALPARLLAYAEGKNLAPTQGPKTVSGGKVEFTNLPVGVYLLAQKEAAPGYLKVNPFLVTIPLEKPEGGYTYDVDATGKMELEPEESEDKTGKLTVFKEVSGSLGEQDRDFEFVVTLSDRTVNGRYGDMYFHDGVAEFTLRHYEQKTAAGLPAGTRYTVSESGNEGYTVTSQNSSGIIQEDDTVQVVFHNHRGGDETEPGEVSVTVKKVWKLDDGGTAARSVTVALMRGSERWGTVTLHTGNNWTHTWTGLDDRYIWTVVELDVPDGFTASVDRNGMTFTITNDDQPEEPGQPDEPDHPDEPDDPDEPGRPDEPDWPDEPDYPDEPDSPDAPKTGDTARTGLWAALCLLSLGGMGALTWQSHRRKDDV